MSAGPPGASDAVRVVDPATVIDIDRLEREVGNLTVRYRQATPFPHIVLDDVVLPEFLGAAYDEFSRVDGETWRAFVHVNERKYANTDLSSWGPALQDLALAFASDRFVTFLGALTGFDGLAADLRLEGGGLHRSLNGGYLNIHADFTAHHTRPNWRRRVNLLLYLNESWDPAWGGDLELWATDMSRCEATVTPQGNRLLLFTTADDSFHGHPDPLACPPDVARQSLALYFFTEEVDPLARSTNYRARPGDGVKGAAIFLDKQVLRAFDVIRRRLHLSEETVSRGLGALDRLRTRGRVRPDQAPPDADPH